ncbi:hypothetical protein [Nonomuraea angiospora]
MLTPPATEVNAAHHLQRQLGQVHPRQHREDPLAQVDQGRWLREGGQLGHVQPSLCIHAHIHAVLSDPARDIVERQMQHQRVLGEQLPGVLR